MTKYIIRNYGPSAQIPYKDKSITITSDVVIETDDPELVSAASSIPNIHVTTRPGAKAVAPPKVEEPISSETEGVAEEPVDFESMTVAALKELAVEKGIELPTRVKKAEIVELLLKEN